VSVLRKNHYIKKKTCAPTHFYTCTEIARLKEKHRGDVLLLYCCFTAALQLVYCCFTEIARSKEETQRRRAAALLLLYCCVTAALLLQ
jgi:hypothetical protein